MDVEANPVFIPIYAVQPIACHVKQFSQYLEGVPPDFKDIRLAADAVIIPYPENRKLISVSVYIEAYKRISEDKARQFCAISATTKCVLLNEHRERVDFPMLLDVAMVPFDSAIDIALT